MTGPINATAPNPVSRKEFSKALGRALGRPSSVRTTEFALPLLLGEVAELVAKVLRVLPAKTSSFGYTIRLRGLDAALRDILAEPATPAMV